jgi:BspA type Leucine rich repeat region (6 copies)
MKTDIMRTLLQALLLAVALPAALQAQFTFTTNKGTTTITGYDGPGGAVTIPATINGLSVTSIGEDAFYNNTTLTSVTIPDGVTNIGDAAFANCWSLAQVTILNSVTSIGEGAFLYCTSLTSVTIPDSMTSIGPSAFESSGLTNLTIPDSVNSIGGHAFFDCEGLTNVIIPESVTSVGDYAFADTKLTSVTIPDSATNIANEAFQNCHSLTAITVAAQNPVYSCVDGALFDKNQTTLVEYPAGGPANYTIPDSVTSIEDEAFSGTGVAGVTIGNGVTSIQDNTFLNCESLTNVTIPDSVTSISSKAFQYCRSLTSVTIGNGVTNISSDMFIGSDLITIEVSAQNPIYSSVDGVLFNKSLTTLILCPPRLGSYTIPNGVTNIGNYAFGYCYFLANVTIPNSVTSIGSGAFYECFSLKNVIIPNSIISIGSNAFYECSSLRRIYFSGSAPATDSSVFSADYTTAYHLTNTSGWSNTFASIPTAAWNPAPPPTLHISQSTSGVMTLSWQGNMVLMYSRSLDFNYPWFRAGDTSPVTAPIPLVTLRFGNFTGPVGLNSQFFRLLDVTDLVADFYANLDLARNYEPPISIRLKACKTCAADFFLFAPFGELIDSGGGEVDEVVSIGYDLDPTDPVLLHDIGLLTELRSRYGP